MVVSRKPTGANDNSNASTLGSLGTFKLVQENLNEFRLKHPHWSARWFRQESTYAITQAAIDGLALVNFFSEADLAAERAFTRLCHRHEAIGLRDGVPICYLSLFSNVRKITDGLSRPPGWPANWREIVANLLDQCDSQRIQLLGVAGRLMTEPKFLNELASLKKQWLELPASQRPPLPLRRPVRATQDFLDRLGRCREAMPALLAFVKTTVQFLDRWGLVSLVDWDLPEPQGPVLPGLLSPTSQAMPHHGLHLVIPLHHSLSPDDLLNQIQLQRVAAANEVECPEDIVDCPHFEQYSQMFRVMVLENAIRSRFVGKLPSGLVKRIISAAGTELGRSNDHISYLRRAISACRRGKRSADKRLRTPK